MAVIVRAGRLRHRITVQSPLQVVDAHGDTVETWVTVRTVWAAIEPVSARELVRAGALDALLTHHIRARHIAGITPGWRVLHDNRVFNISSVINRDERNASVELMCIEVVE